MIGAFGLRGQSAAPPLTKPGRGLSRGPVSLMGLVPRVLAISLSFAPANIGNSSESSSINSAYVTVTPVAKRRGEVFAVRWAQVSGTAGVASDPTKLTTRFEFSGLSVANHPQVWRAFVTNNYGEAGVIDVAFSITRAWPSLSAGSSPNGLQMVPIDPGTRTGTCYFSAFGVGGVPPYSYNWGGGDNPTSASNSATFYIPPGATEGINFSPGCTVSDSVGQSVVVGAGPFFIYES